MPVGASPDVDAADDCVHLLVQREKAIQRLEMEHQRLAVQYVVRPRRGNPLVAGMLLGRYASVARNLSRHSAVSRSTDTPVSFQEALQSLHSRHQRLQARSTLLARQTTGVPALIAGSTIPHGTAGRTHAVAHGDDERRLAHSRQAFAASERAHPRRDSLGARYHPPSHAESGRCLSDPAAVQPSSEW
jgi:hypothetical protein